MLTVSLIIFIIAIILLGLSGIIFRIRAITNKRAWNGPVVPLATMGLILFVISLVMIYFYYPR